MQDPDRTVSDSLVLPCSGTEAAEVQCSAGKEAKGKEAREEATAGKQRY